MKLRHLKLDRSPGLASGFELADIAPGVNVILGRNASGKTSLCRAVRALLWPEAEFRGAAAATWEIGGQECRVERETGLSPRWSGARADYSGPSLPDARFRRCFTLSIDDFLKDDGTDEEIQREMAKELAAGFDLTRVLADKRGRHAAGRRVAEKAGALVDAGAKRELVRDAHQALLEEERGLEPLRADLEASAEALRAANAYKSALALARARVDLRECQAALSGFDSGMESLRGDEAKRLEALRKDLRLDESNLAQALADALSAERELQASGLAAPVPPEDLSLLETREKTLRTLQDRFDTAALAESEAAAALGAANRRLRRGAGANEPNDFGEDRWNRLEKALRELHQAIAEATALEAELGVHSDPDAYSGPEPPFEKGIAALSRWLEGGCAEAPSRLEDLRGPLETALGVLCLIVAATGVGVTALLVVVGVALLGFGIWKIQRGGGGGRDTWVREYQALPLDQPDDWNVGAVTVHLVRLQESLAESSAHKVRRQFAGALASKIARARDTVAVREADFEEICVSCGVSPATAHAGVAELASVLFARTQASDQLERAQAGRLEAKAGLGRELDRAAETLRAHGLEAVEDADELRSCCKGLLSRENLRSAAVEKLARAHADGERHEKLLGERTRQLDEFLADLELGPGGEAELASKLEALDRWSSVQTRLRDSESKVRELEALLEERPDLGHFGVDEAGRALGANDELARLQEQRAKEVARIEADVHKARSGYDLEQALASEDLARETLIEVREGLFESATADFLLESVARDHQSLTQPDILRRADEWFTKFTHHSYMLASSQQLSTEGQAFEVHEASGGRKEISELSSGTLAQLCLALRLSVAQSVEVGERLPVFLDEALTNSDPARFREVARCLAELAKDGRQVFFLTSDPEDALRLEEALAESGAEAPRRFDLDALRGAEAAAAGLGRTSLAEVPAPGATESAREYGERLVVPAIDPFGGVDALHLFYLSSEDLPGLYELLEQRVETVGEGRKLLESDARLWSAERRAAFEGRRAFAAAWFEGHKIGRAPALHPETLRCGPAGKTKLIDSVIEISEEFGGDGKALIEALRSKKRDSRLKGFRAAKVEELALDLERSGLYSPRDPIAPEERLERCLTAVRSFLEADSLSREEVFQLDHAFAQWVGCEAPSAPGE